MFCLKGQARWLAALRVDLTPKSPIVFGAIDCRNSHSGPVLSGATAFECTVDQIITHGSHDICIGNVTAITNAATPPLAYMDGSFQIVRPEGAS
jgi:flavin reductase